MFKKILIVFTLAMVGGCATPEPEYVSPSDGPVSEIIVDTDVPIAVNKPVYFHYNNLCEFSDVKLAGYVSKSNGPLYYADDVVKVTVKADEVVYLSLPLDHFHDAEFKGTTTTVTMLYTQPILSFIPKADTSYRVKFNPYNVSLYIIQKNGQEINRSDLMSLVGECEISSDDKGESGKAFYLKSATR
ncbi:hypothetical protein [Photobacterium sp. TY1-4]|uniref:hypothetical protein n=1 Tax=Photobacterium sp. TY1-4 TaxID=2899122 RepID=UPI0021BF02A7|nr:hypothetical protein [Photobacterium sp. TY1-4]UXI03444.1 hypothetical protein NH461_23765 [Photobacterium sp. TY1-4]